MGLASSAENLYGFFFCALDCVFVVGVAFFAVYLEGAGCDVYVVEELVLFLYHNGGFFKVNAVVASAITLIANCY